MNSSWSHFADCLFFGLLVLLAPTTKKLRKAVSRGRFLSKNNRDWIHFGNVFPPNEIRVFVIFLRPIYTTSGFSLWKTYKTKPINEWKLWLVYLLLKRLLLRGFAMKKLRNLVTFLFFSIAKSNLAPFKVIKFRKPFDWNPRTLLKKRQLDTRRERRTYFLAASKNNNSKQVLNWAEINRYILQRRP